MLREFEVLRFDIIVSSDMYSSSYFLCTFFSKWENLTDFLDNRYQNFLKV